MPYKHLCFVLAASLALVTIVAINEAIRVRTRPVHVRSELVVPTTKLLADINSLVEAGACELAAEKLQLWEELWNEYLRGGETPEGFCQRILQLARQRESLKVSSVPSSEVQTHQQGQR